MRGSGDESVTSHGPGVASDGNRPIAHWLARHRGSQVIASLLTLVGLAVIGAISAVTAAPGSGEHTSSAGAESLAPPRQGADVDSSSVATSVVPDTGHRSTRFGASFQLRRGESYADGLARTETSLGRLEVVRVFYPGPPAKWPGKAEGRSVIVSFKLDPERVLAGRYDDRMRTWFAATPRDVDVYWVYWHEPEDDVEGGDMTAGEYRHAFARLNRLAQEAANPRLRSTLVLMSWTLQEESGRDWRDYYPGDDAVDVFAWDVYNRPTLDVDYRNPADLFDGLRKVSASVGKPWGIAELGSVRVSGDDGTHRAAWLRAAGDYLVRHDAAFVAWFHFSWNGGEDDYRLLDAPSLAAWRGMTGD